MKEDFLHYVWNYKLFSLHKLKTTKNETIEILNSGMHNTNSGPDFLNSKLKIDNQIWAGNVEIHIKSSDWYAHNHEQDTKYDAVILHVVYENDVNVFMENNEPIPVLELKELIDKKLLNNYNQLFSSQLRWIPCEKQIASTNSFVLNNWLERLYFERLEAKSNVINELLVQSNTDYEAVLFQLLAKNFGLKVNADAFLQLAKSIDFSLIRKERHKAASLAALLFGQAGFLNDNIEDGYYVSLKKEYDYLKHKYNLNPISNGQFQFFRMRPSNFPTIRIAQLISLYHLHQNLFSKLMEVQKLEDFYVLFSVGVHPFWKTHYTFETESKSSAKRITKSFVDLLLINTIIPLKFTYQKSRGEVNEKEIVGLMQQLKPEKNSILTKFFSLQVKAENAFESQGLLELKNNYCAKKRCLDCAIGNNLLRE